MTPQVPPRPARQQAPYTIAWDDVSHWLAWLALGVAFLYLAVRYGPGHAHAQVLYNSDAMFIPVFFRDVMARVSMAGWDLPTSPFFFPDMALFFPLLATIPNIRVATLLFGLLQLGLLCVGYLWLQRRLFAGQRAAQTFMLLTLALTLLFIAVGRQSVFPFAFISVHHMSVLMVLPFATVALLTALQPPGTARRGRALALLYALTLLMAHSETLFIIQFVLPALAALILWGRSPQVSWRDLGMVAGGLIMAAAAGQWLRGFIVSPDKLLLYTKLTPTAITTAWANFVAWLLELIRTDPIFIAVWIIGIAALIGIISVARRQQHARLCAAALVATLALASMLVSLAAAIGSGNFIDTYATRYILPTVYLPLLLGLPIGLAWWGEARGQHDHTTAAAILLGCSSAATVGALALLWFAAPLLTPTAFANFPAYQEPFMACLQRESAQRQLRYGLANFWQANMITAQSNGELEVVAVDDDLAPVLWNNNRYRYTAPFEFVIIEQGAAGAWQLERPFVIQHFGVPHDEFTCANSTILVYNHPATAPLRQWFAHHPSLVHLRQPGDVAELYGYTLRTNIDAMVIGLSQGASEQWDQEEGTLAYAPLKQLAAGSYAVRLDLFTDRSENGTWKVVASTDEGRTTLHRAPITQTGSSTVIGHFDLETTADVDIVVEYNGRGTLYVDRILVGRVDPAQAATIDFDTQFAPHMPESAALHLLYPPPGSVLPGGVTDFAWEWTGAPLPPEETFEVRLWRAGEDVHFGAHDARASQDAIRRIGTTYLLHLDLRGAHSVMQHGAGDYEWTVARVAVTPTYQDLHQEAAPFAVTVQP